jgi:hypothetical protein
VVGIARLAEDLHADIDAFVRIARGAADQPRRVESMKSQIFEHLSRRLSKHGFTGAPAAQHAVLAADIALNAAGLDAWLARRRA